MGKPKVADGAVAVVRTEWRETVLICRKCTKKLDGGFGEAGEATLRAALREALRERGARRHVGILQAGCFGICPKDAVTVAQGKVPGELLVVGKGADMESLLDRWKMGQPERL